MEHLLTMTSRVAFNEKGAVACNDWVQGFLDSPVNGPAGLEFEYNSMNTYMLSAIVGNNRTISDGVFEAQAV